VFGLMEALDGEVTLARGRVTKSNFHNYRLITTCAPVNSAAFSTNNSKG
jgi:hypothetical protein